MCHTDSSVLPSPQSLPTLLTRRNTTDGFSCREMIRQETDRRALHFAQVLQMGLHEGPAGPQNGRPKTHRLQPSILATRCSCTPPPLLCRFFNSCPPLDSICIWPVSATPAASF